MTESLWTVLVIFSIAFLGSVAMSQAVALARKNTQLIKASVVLRLQEDQIRLYKLALSGQGSDEPDQSAQNAALQHAQFDYSDNNVGVRLKYINPSAAQIPVCVPTEFGSKVFKQYVDEIKSLYNDYKGIT